MLDGRYRFESFVVGAGNRLAAAAARAVAEAPGAAYNPLVLYGAPGLGKTHLLGALGHLAQRLHPARTVRYQGVESLVTEYLQAVAAGQGDGFTRRVAMVDVLLLDDLQFLSGHHAIQAELLRLITTLQEAGHQLVMTSDRAPAEIPDVDQRLLSRLSGGLILDIAAPDYETRVAILRRLTEGRATPFGPGVLEAIARLPLANVRELQGALHRVAAQQDLLGGDVGPGDVSALLGPPATGAPAPARAAAPTDEFEAFLRDVSSVVEASVEGWQAGLRTRMRAWEAEGFAIGRLAQALERPDAVDAGALEAAFAADVDRLRALEAEAVRLDPRSAGLAIFRDPSRLGEAEAFVARAAAHQAPLPAPHEAYRLSDLVRTPGNHLALEAAAAVVAAPGRAYNPLCVHGPAGAGKTHLLHAIGNALLARAGGRGRIACLAARALADELIEALAQDGVERWRARYRAADALLVDDVHDLAGGDRTQEELFHLFNALQDAGRPVVLSADRPLAALTALPDRLRSRFEAGLVVAMAPPVGLAAAAPPPADAAGAPDPFFLDPEKVVLAWPGWDGRLVEGWA